MAEAVALFFAAFLAATILPFSSEVALVGAVTAGMSPTVALISASLGNVLAVVLNYALGFWFYEKMHNKLNSSKIGKRTLLWGHRYGYIALPLSVLPVIGDPLTIVAGMLRLNFIYFIVIAALLRVVRYYLITLAF